MAFAASTSCSVNVAVACHQPAVSDQRPPQGAPDGVWAWSSGSPGRPPRRSARAADQQGSRPQHWPARRPGRDERAAGASGRGAGGRVQDEGETAVIVADASDLDAYGGASEVEEALGPSQLLVADHVAGRGARPAGSTSGTTPPRSLVLARRILIKAALAGDAPAELGADRGMRARLVREPIPGSRPPIRAGSRRSAPSGRWRRGRRSGWPPTRWPPAAAQPTTWPPTRSSIRRRSSTALAIRYGKNASETRGVRQPGRLPGLGTLPPSPGR